MDPEQMLERAPHSPMAGTGWLSVVLIFPIGLPVETESGACTEQGVKIAAILADRDAGTVR